MPTQGLLMDDIANYLCGRALYGDNFNLEQIAEWYADEEEAYANLGAGNSAAYSYGYHAWNWYHAYRHLETISYDNVLGFGSAYGDELKPIATRMRKVTVVDPSLAFVRTQVHGVPATYVKPAPNGRLPLMAGEFDYISCLGVLHHIPNVSFVLSELARVLATGGHMVVREPIVSMGDWRQPRRGLTKRERGIPLHVLESIIQACGLQVTRKSLCAFPVTPRLFRTIRSDTYNSRFATRVDALLSGAFAWNVNYHPTNFLQRLRPTSAFLVLKKA